MDELMSQLRDAVVAFREPPALEATRALIDAGVQPERILEEGLTAAMGIIGERWKRGQVFLPQVMVAARIFARCGKLVEPLLLERGGGPGGDLVLLATVKGDLHDLGKSIVGAMIRTAGFEVQDLGKNVATQQIVQAVREQRPRLLGLSAMLTTTMPEQEAVVRALESEGLRGGLHIIVGGAPVTERWAEKIGADGYAANSADAVTLARRLAASEA